MEEQYLYAKLAQGSYGGQPIEGYNIDPQFSNQNRTLYVNKDTGKAVYSFRGTDLATRSNKWKDLGTDALLALGLKDLSSRFQNAEQATKDAIQKYGKDNITLTGTSLGGSQGIYVAQKTGLPARVFNAGVSPLDVKRTKGAIMADTVANLLRPKTKSNVIAYTSIGDPISSLTPFLEGVKTIPIVPKNKRNPHSLKNFLP